MILDDMVYFTLKKTKQCQIRYLRPFLTSFDDMISKYGACLLVGNHFIPDCAFR